MIVLAIDTASANTSVALYDEQVIAETTWLTSRDHTRQLLPQIDALLHVAGRSMTDVTAIAISLGPGSFNGLRVGLATAKAMSDALNLPIVGIDTLRALAYQFRALERPIRPIFNAGRGELATGLYEGQGKLFGTIEEPHLATLDAALDSSPSNTFFCGEIAPAWRVAIADRFGDDNTIAAPAESVRRAGYLAELAAEQIAAGLSSERLTLEPIYLRLPPVLESQQNTQSGRG